MIELSNEHGVAALRWLLDHRHDFGLREQDLARLAGADSELIVDAWLTEKESVPESAIQRFGLLLAIYRGLVAITPTGNKQMAFEWFQRPSDLFPEFSPLSIRDYLLQDPSEEALEVAVRSIKGRTL